MSTLLEKKKELMGFDYDNPEECLRGVKKNGYALRFVKEQTPEICLEAVRRDGCALEYVKEQTPEICMEAVKQNGCALEYVKEQTPEICLEAVKRDGYTLEFAQEQTPEICMEAVKSNGMALQFVKEQTPEICLEAVKRDGCALMYVKEQTPEICLAAVNQDKYALIYVVADIIPLLEDKLLKKDDVIQTEKARIALFEKVSEESYDIMLERDKKIYGGNIALLPYEQIKLPKRATSGSAGYDFITPVDIHLMPGESVVVKTYIRCKIDSGWVLQVYPKSGLGFKYNMILANTVGIIDEDYYNTVSDNDSNEGHIMIKLVNNGDKEIHIARGSKFCQGLFTIYGICKDDDETDMKVRSGGFGSTGA